MSDEINKSTDLVEGPEDMDRRGFIGWCSKTVPAGVALFTFGIHKQVNGTESPPPVSPAEKEQFGTETNNYAMAVDISKCIGCGRCAAACKKENKVPDGPHTVRTWVERYVIPQEGETMVDSPNAGIDGFPDQPEDVKVLKSFFVPKLCNHCANPPCVQACPYGARYIHPEKRVADKCTFCYHRLAKGLLPACVEVCPTQARVFGDLKKLSSPIHRFLRFHPIKTLKPELNTRPKVFYANADGEVR